MTSSSLNSYRKLAFVFFGIFGFIHISTSLLLSNQIIPEIANLINKIFDIPFALIAVIYTVLSIEYSEKSLQNKTVHVLGTIFVVITLLLLLYTNFIIPDRI